MHLRKLTSAWRTKKCLLKCGSWIYYPLLTFIEFHSRTILLAGHETSATTLCWVLLELARNPEVQKRLRDEIRETEIAVHARGDSDFTAADLENMSYLCAVMKVPCNIAAFGFMCFLADERDVSRNLWDFIQHCTRTIDKLLKITYCLFRSLSRQ